MKICLHIGDTVISATIDDTPAGRDFYALLPLTLNMQDFANAEKIADLPKPLSLARALDGYSAESGDITYYSPWGNLALFYKSSAYAQGLVKIGRMTSRFDALSQHHEVTVNILAQT